MPERYHRLRVSDVITETEDTCSLVFDIPAELTERFRYRPGQFLTMQIPSADRESVARCYSLASSPHTGEPLKVTVKRTIEGYASQWIHEHVHAGSVLEVLPPAGTFTPRALDRDFLFLAAGSGITPVMSIISSALAKGSGQLVLIYANRNEQSVIFAAQLAELVREQPDRFVAVHWLESLHGLPAEAGLRALARPFTDHEAFICGPTPFMAAAMNALHGLGMPGTRVHAERFHSLTENPFAAAPPTAAPADGAVTTVEVALNQEKHTIGWPAGQRLLDALLAAGLDAPFSCREGKCGACACVALDGTVTMNNNEVLDEQDLADGYILACQSLPDSDSLTISYE
ncbi:MAG TPA: ferredoxin--NADP reductase [Pseudonocardiaceae bacterium]|jgi:3-ketosteroid 9alpha-monooxygenase subunit B|nr:ferredoxin--NADP reductase [Pseudonocardiaceae bacterium]